MILMDIEQSLVQKKKIIEEELECILPSGNSSLEQAMRYAVFSGGKRFRPLLTLSTAEYLGAETKMVLPFACAVELVHNYSLIHDDLPALDNDNYRRGKPSCHIAYGVDTALLAGDGLLTLSFQVLAQSPLDKRLYGQRELVIEAVSTGAGVEGMIGGQFLDITLTSERISEDKLQELMLKKTGALIIAAVKVGAILGEASPAQEEALVEYAKRIGQAFQIRDDILDAGKDREKTHFSHPNAVSLWGLDKSRVKLKKLVEEGLQFLDKRGLEAEELRFVAQKLLFTSEGMKK